MKKNKASYQEAKKIVEVAKIISKTHYGKNYKSISTRLPYNPDSYYRQDWEGWPVFLKYFKKEKRLSPLVARPSFLQLKKIVQKEKIKSVNDYAIRRLDVCKTAPTNPSVYYQKEWKNWYEFLGKEPIETAAPIAGFPNYKEAKKILKRANFDGGRREYVQRCTSFEKRLPSAAQKYYKLDWISWGEYLDNNNISKIDIKFLSFAEAIEKIETFKFVSKKDYINYCRNNKTHLPITAEMIYRNEWNGWAHYLSKKKKPIKKIKEKLFDYDQAKNVCLDAGINGQTIYRVRHKIVSARLPSAPEIKYKNNGWNGWKEFLDTTMLTYEEAQKHCINARVKSMKDYTKRRLNICGQLPASLPAFYQEEWLGWDIFLKRTKTKASYQEAREACKSANIKTLEDFRKNYKALKIKIPSNPNVVYKEWISWPKFLS